MKKKTVHKSGYNERATLCVRTGYIVDWDTKTLPVCSRLSADNRDTMNGPLLCIRMGHIVDRDTKTLNFLQSVVCRQSGYNERATIM